MILQPFLAISMYLFRWVVYGVTLVLRDIMFALFIETSYMWNHPIQQVIMYAIVELVYFTIALTSMYLVIKLIHKVYVNKKEDITKKELLLLFATMFSVMLGYFSFNFFSNVYIEDMEMNHISVLENLFLKNETEELEKYMAQLKTSLCESVAEIKTGNPVTDMIIN